MNLAEQWRALGSELPTGWGRAELRLELRDEGTAAEAAGLLAPAQPYRAKPNVLCFASALDGSALSPDNVVRLLRRLDNARIGGTLTLEGSDRAAVRAQPEVTPLAESWRRALATLPADWSDLLCELELLSTDYIEPAAVLCIQMNPRRDQNRAALRFRAAREAGYGVSPQMAGRCFERCDEADIRGSVTVLRVLSDTKLAATQGPVWMLDGKTV